MARVRWLQTSDVHLRADRPERRRALELVFDAAVDRDADAVLVAGDLFDRSSDAAAERSAVRELVEAFAPRPVVFLPGNHDADAYGADADFGANAVVLGGCPHTIATVCGVEVVGVPYQRGRTVAECLTDLPRTPRRPMLVAHGTVSDVAGAFAGEGEEQAYMPATAADLLERFAYSAFGHLHSGRNLVRRSGACLVAYAGSPVATSRRELGPRAALVVDLEPGLGVAGHEVVPLSVPYYERTEVACLPGSEAAAIAELARRASELRAPNVRVLARLSGVSIETESALRAAATSALRATAGGSSATEADAEAAPMLELAVSSFADLAQVPIVTEFVTRLTAAAGAQEGCDPRVLETALSMGLRAFLEA